MFDNNALVTTAMESDLVSYYNALVSLLGIVHQLLYWVQQYVPRKELFTLAWLIVSI